MAQSILSGVLSFVAEGVMVFASDGKVTLVNPHASLLLDAIARDIIGAPIDEVLKLSFDEHSLPPGGGIAHTIFTAKKVFTAPSGKTPYLTSCSGRRFPVFIAARALTIEADTIGVLIFRDITKEKELEHYKKDTAERLSELTPILQRAATGDFSEVPMVPHKEDEFTELYVGLRLMVEDLREIAAEREREQAERIAVVKKAEKDRRHLAEEYTKHLEGQVREKTRESTQSKVHVETILENLMSGLLEYNNTFTLLRMNRSAEELLGVPRGEVVGKEILPKDLGKEHWQSLVDVSYPALSPEAKKVKHEVLRKGVDVTNIKVNYPLARELQVITAPVINSITSERQGFIKLVRDITREKTIARSKSEFISIAAHQLRTPLSAIKWVLHMVINGDLGSLNASQKELLKNGYDTNEKMIRLVNDLLNVARIEEGRFGYNFKRDDIMTVIDSVLASIKGFALGKKVEVKVETPSGPPPPFVFDASKISLVLQNLVDNAVKYTPDGGSVSVAVGVEDENAVVRVSDSGIGVPKDQMDRLFTKFFRAGNAVHMQTNGSGLGLYLAKNVVLRHGGELTVKSTEGKGSVFTFTLPLDADRIPKDDTGVEE